MSASVKLPTEKTGPKTYGDGGMEIRYSPRDAHCEICGRKGRYIVTLAGWSPVTDKWSDGADRRAKFCAAHMREMASIWESKGKEITDE